MMAGIAGLGSAALAQSGGDTLLAAHQDWTVFRNRYVTSEGRIIDTGNAGVSHSEGQGYGLLFAVTFDDAETFDRILAWTAHTLRRRPDLLHAWRYMPGAKTPVADTNNATDGDILIAASMLRAARKWGRPDLAIAAGELAADILHVLVRDIGNRIVLLPGAVGFDTARSITVNPSYYNFCLLRELSSVAPSPLWARLEEDGLRIIAEGRFGSARLPPDWLRISRDDGCLTPADAYPARFSYDAVRIPLHLAWTGLSAPGLQTAYEAFCDSAPRVPAWVDLKTNNLASYQASSGMVAVSMFARARSRGATVPQLPSVRLAEDYYSAAITLLTKIACLEVAALRPGRPLAT
jgi:endoglucanase